MDPSISSRIFVANLAPLVDHVALRERFKPYGLILGVTLNKGFGFVQFKEESSAKEAIAKEHNSDMLGRKLDVKQARRTNSGKEAAAMSNYYDGGNSGYAGYGRQQPRPFEGLSKKSAGASSLTRNDCEIVCLSREQRYYAESVESRLKHLGMTVDVLFPNQDVSLESIVTNISDRGVLFAVIITATNEEHRSLTVNLLQQGAEHRNMPLEDAIPLLASNFEKVIDVQNKTGILPGGKHPQDILNVLGFLAEDRPLSVMEYDKLIKYLSQRREQMLRMEYGDDIPAHLINPPIGPSVDPATKAKQAELHAKIMEVLNRERLNSTPREPRAVIVPPSVVAAKTPTTQGAQPALDPGLQKAIDSLIKTGPNLLSSMSTSNTQARPSYTQQQGYDQRQQGYDQRQEGFDQRQQGFDQRQQGFDQRQQGFDQRQQAYGQEQLGYGQQQLAFGQQQQQGYGQQQGFERGQQYQQQQPSFRPQGQQQYRPQQQQQHQQAAYNQTSGPTPRYSSYSGAF